LIDIDEQSGRLHTDVPRSSFRRVSGAGHMVHQTATDDVMSAIEEAARLGKAAIPATASPVAGKTAHAAE
jgi:hypothetical protein